MGWRAGRATFSTTRPAFFFVSIRSVVNSLFAKISISVIFTPMNQSTRDKLRAATLGAKNNFQKKVVTINGESFELRQMSIRDRSEVRALTVDENGFSDPYAFNVRSVIRCTYAPETGEKVFEDADFEALMDLPADSFMDLLVAEMAKMINVSTDTEKKHSKTSRKSG
jgi:hypothetical protein